MRRRTESGLDFLQGVRRRASKFTDKPTYNVIGVSNQMPTVITVLLSFFLALLSLIGIIDLLFSRKWKTGLAELGFVVIVAVVLHFTTGYPTSREAFGGSSPLTVIAIMLVCTMLGVAARYFFYLEGEFRWRSFLKP